MVNYVKKYDIEAEDFRGKFEEDGASCEAAPDEAMAQIKKKGYADRFAPGGATLIGIAVDRTARLVKARRINKL